MIAELIAFGLMRAEVAATAAALLVFALRLTARSWFGAEAAYRLWTLVPAAVVASLFACAAGHPPDVVSTALQSWTDGAFIRSHTKVILTSWAAGASGFMGLTLWLEVGFRRRVRRRMAGPAVVGVLTPRLVTPWNFEALFEPQERLLIRAHELAHIERGDPAANALIALLIAFAWFNPLAYLAAGCARSDQELACDAAVLQQRPGVRRAYAEALLKAQVAAENGALACAWAAPRRLHVEVRIANIRSASGVHERRRILGELSVAGLVFLVASVIIMEAPRSRVHVQKLIAAPAPLLLIDLSPARPTTG